MHLKHLLTFVARTGCTVIVPYREDMMKRHLKVAGDLGRVVFMVRLMDRMTVYH